MYTSWQIAVGALLGTPIGGGWLLASNYKAMGSPKLASRALLVGIAVTLAFVFLLWLLSAYLPLLLFPLFFGGIYHIVAEVKQGDAIKSSREETKKTASWTLPLAVGLIGIPLFVAGIFWFPQLNNDPNSGTVYLGPLEHELRYFDVPPTEAQNIGQQLQQANHFGNDFKTFVELKKSNNSYTLYLPSYTTNWNDSSFHVYLSELHALINSDTIDIHIVLFDGEDNDRKEKTFQP